MKDRRPKIGLREVRESFRENQPQLLIVKYVGRPLGDLATPFFYNNGYTANQVTYFRSVLMAVALVLFVLPSQAANIAGAVLSFVGFVLDCTDGNLARMRNDATYFGKYIDGLADGIFAWFAPAATGLTLTAQTGEIFYSLIGVAGTCASLCTLALRSRLSFAREWMVNQTGAVTEAERAALGFVTKVERKALSFYSHVILMSPFLAVLPDGKFLYLASVGLLQLPCDLFASGAVLRQASMLLSRKRTSIWAQRPDPAK